MLLCFTVVLGVIAFHFVSLPHFLLISLNSDFSVHRHGTRNIGEKYVKRIDLLVEKLQSKYLSDGVPNDQLKWILGRIYRSLTSILIISSNFEFD